MLTFETEQFRWLGIELSGSLTIAWPWLVLLTALLTLAVVATLRAFRKRGERSGEPWRTKFENADQLLKVQKEGHAAEVEYLNRRLIQETAEFTPLLNELTKALGPAYPAKTVRIALSMLGDFKHWCDHLTAELKVLAPDTFGKMQGNVLADDASREAFKAFVLRTARASREFGAEALAAKDQTIQSLERAAQASEQTVNALRDEVSRLNGVVNAQAIKISQLETEIPALTGKAIEAVQRVSKKRD